MDPADAFRRFDAELNLDPAERLRAEAFHNKLTIDLKADGLVSGGFLQGSFARKTMLKPLRDIDKVLILHGDLDYLESDPQGAQKAAVLMEEALRAHYPEARISHGRHSIQLDLGDDTFSFDVVPAFEAADGSNDVMIMDLGSDGLGSLWMRSNTRDLIDVVGKRNQLCEGSFVHQVRFVKHWARERLESVLPGLHVESIAFACVNEQLLNDAAVESIFACGARLLGPLQEYTDPTGVDRLSSKLDGTARETACNAFVDAAKDANEAMERGERGDSEGANSVWYSLFGDPFPRPGDQEARYLRSLVTGASVVAGSGVVASGARPTRASGSN
jgi:hypothetical protein